MLSLIRHLLTGHVYVRHDDGRIAGPLRADQWSGDGGTTPHPNWVEQPYDLQDGAWSAGETFEYIVASGGRTGLRRRPARRQRSQIPCRGRPHPGGLASRPLASRGGRGRASRGR